jgi:sugar lactone lactonase YvrE
MKSTKPNLTLPPKPDILRNISLSALLILFLFSYSSCSDDDDDDKNPGETDPILEEIAMGARLHGANGINFGPDDNLYIASFYGQEVVSMNKQTGEIITSYGVDKNILGPDDLIFHPDGESFYYTDILTGFVGRMTLDGTLLGYQEVGPGVNPVTFSDDGRLFVALDFQGDGLYELDPNLVDPPRAIVPYVPDTFPLGFLNAFDFGPDGRLYGPSFLFGLVISVDVGEPGDPPTSDPFGDGTAQVVADGFTYPVAAKFGPDGLLTLLDQTGEVFKINVETGETTLFANLQPGLDNLAFDADGNLFVSNADFGWIVELLPSGETRTVREGGMIGPQGLAVLQESNRDAVYVGDVFRMQKFNGANGDSENDFKGYLVPQPEKLTMPFSVHADGGNLVVSSWFSNLVQVWNPQTDQAIEEYAMVAPIDAVRVNNEIVVSDLGQGGVVKASDNSQIVPLIVASGLATDGETLWAADWATGQVFQINYEGGNAQAPVEVASGLLNPEGLAFEKEGYLVVVETGANRLSRIDLASGEVTMLFENLELGPAALEGAPPTLWFDGVAVGPSGNIYVSGWGANVLYRVSKE